MNEIYVFFFSWLQSLISFMIQMFFFFGDKYNVVDKYEYVVVDNLINGNVYIRWEIIIFVFFG